MKLNQLPRALLAIFRPPFDGLALLVWLYFVWCFLVHPASPILRGDFIDNDDPMYLVHMLDWMKGQGWYDTVQHRLNPPDGVPIHFSRLAELPLAGLTWLWRCTGLGWIGASTLAAALWPPALLGGLLVALRGLAAGFVPRSWAGASAFVVLFSPILLFQFTPGHVDHHGLALVIVTLGLLCVSRMIVQPSSWLWPLGAGLLLALGQVVALETLPWLVLLSGSVLLWQAVQGGAAARAGGVFGFGLLAGSSALLLISRAPQDWAVPSVLAYSVVYVALTGGVALSFGGVALAAPCRGWARLLVGGGLALASALLFLRHFPELLAGPYGGVDKALGHLLFDNISEALSLAKGSRSLADALLKMAQPLLALVVCAFYVRRARGEERWLWGLIALLLLSASLLAAFYQVRVRNYAALFSVVPLTALLRDGLAYAAHRWQGRARAAAELGVVMLVGPLLGVLLPATVDNRAFNTGVLLFPVQVAANACDTYALEKILNNPRLYGDRPRILMNMMDEGPELLYRTQHMVLAAPYHTNVQGNLDAVQFFSASDPAAARKIAQEHKIELVVMCRMIPAMYLGAGPNQIDMSGGAIVTKPGASFAEQLIYGKIPAWLERKDFPGLTNYLLFEVRGL